MFSATRAVYGDEDSEEQEDGDQEGDSIRGERITEENEEEEDGNEEEHEMSG